MQSVKTMPTTTATTTATASYYNLAVKQVALFENAKALYKCSENGTLTMGN